MADKYTVTKLLYRDEAIILYRGVRERDDLPIIIKALSMKSPYLRLIERMKHEYEINQELKSIYAVKVYALITIESRLSLILEDFGGVPLELTPGKALELGQFFDIAIQLAAALADIHRQGIIHRDIKPGNILINPQTGMIKLSDFGIASTISRTPVPENLPALIEGTLAYISPEQTGRMNRALDHRSDLYSLGVTFYEMLTGRLPFQAHDPLEWIHCHIARQPQAPDELLPSIPHMVSEIILKLLTKQAEERYQSAEGLQFDLKRCREEWGSKGKIEPFPAGEYDISELFLIPRKLYGRDEQISTLLQAFKRVVETGKPEFILVSGFSGIGKSALVGELYKPIVHEWGYFISGKFDQLKRNIPYSIFARAFHDFIMQILTESEDRVRMWKNELGNALGENGQLIVDIIPQIELVIGKQPQISDLPPSEAKNRLNAVFQRFIGVIAKKEHPLTLFLDDLQWLDIESMKLIENIIMNQNIRYLFLIGAYRDNEVTPRHPLMITINQLKKKKAPINDIILTPLSVEHVQMLIEDTFHRKDKNASSLARLVYNKTGGNPFFVIQFITELWEEQLITFDTHSGTWRWDIKKIMTKGFTENIIDLMVGKLHRLPAATQNFLKIAACIGNTSKVHMVAIALGQSDDKIHHHLKKATNEGLIIRSDGTYRFLHDRVQEAAYSLIPENRHAAKHLEIGRLLLAGMAKEEIDEEIFEVLNQLNRGSSLIKDLDEKYCVAELNLMGAKKAIASMAYASATTYLIAGIANLSPDSWETHYELTHDLYYNLAECKYLTGIFDESDRLLSLLLENVRTKVEKANVYRVRIALHTTKGDMEKAIEFGIEGIRLFGMELESHPSREEVELEFSNVWEMLGERPIEELIDMPPMVDEEMKIAMNLLADLGTPAIFARRNLLHITLAHMVTISIKKGNTDASVWGYTWFGATLVQRDFAKYRDGYRFGKLAYDLMIRNNLSRYKAKVCIMFGDNTNFYVNHIRTDRKYIEMAYFSAIENGDQIWACYSCNHIITNMLTVGDPLDQVWDESVRRLEFVRKAKDPNIEDIIISQQRFILNMQGLTSHYSTFSDSSFKQIEFEKHISESQMQLMVCWYYILKMQALFIYNCIDKAIEASKIAGEMILASGPDIQGADYEFFAALALAAHFRSASSEEQEDYIVKISNHRKMLHEWAETCPENFLDRYALVSAELARITGKEFEAERLYEQAIESAHKNGFVQNEAIANELVARFYRERGFDRTADSYIHEALNCYERWGADGKARHLRQQFPQSIEVHPISHSLTITALQEQFDVMAVLKALQSISQEIMLPGLQETLMRIVLEYSGAQRGFFLLVDDEKLKIQSYAGIKGNEIKVENFSSTSDALPLSILNYVRRTRETVILPDKIKSPIFASDEYIIRRHPRSVLCLPIVLQTRVTGMIYLENDLLDTAFPPGVLTVLELLASQVAISLENARLYENRKKNIEALSSANEYIQQLIESANVMIIGLDPSGNIKMFNKAARLITGYSMEELTGVNLFEKIVPKDRYPHVWKTFHDYQQRTGTLPVNFENPILTKSREERIISWQNSSILGLHGDISTISFGMDITERKRTEEASNRLASIVKYSEDAIIGKTVDGIITSWNPGAEKLYGYSENEVINRPISILLPPGYFDEMPEILERIKKGETIEHFEAVRNRKDGKLIDVFLTISPIKDVEGRITGASTIARDITEHKIMEKKLHAASLYARNLIEASLDPLVTISAQGKILDVNRATELVTGRSREELIGSDFSDYFTEPEKARKGYQEVFEKGFVRDYPLAIRHVSRNITDVLYNATVYKNEAGEVQGVFAAARDITQQKAAEKQLHATSLYARNLIEASLDPLVTISAQGKILDVNRATELVTGRSREELIESDFSDYFTEPEKARKGYQEVFEKGLVRDYSLAIRHISGNIIDVLYNATVYKNEAGEVQGVFAAARDITERKRAENELRRAHDELEIRVRERTSELAKANEALKAEIADRKKAQENLMISLNEKEVLIKEVHHRVKNNLQIVSSMFDLQISYMKDKKAITAFREGQNRVATMALIHEKLYRSKDLARIRFVEYIEELTSNLFFSYGVNSDQIKLKIDVGDVFFDINTAIPCGLIINELVSNSIKHAFPEGRNGEISLKLQIGKDGKFILTVRDNGIGFPQDMDFRKSETLGLKLVITLTKQLDGAIELDRSAGTGFVITFSELKYKEMR